MNDYDYSGLPITPMMIESLVVQLFNGQTKRREEIVLAVLDFHLSKGGLKPTATDFPRSVKKALSNLRKQGIASNRSYGFWEINKKDAPMPEPESAIEEPLNFADIPYASD